jgi:anti-sigma factor RsiW
MDVCRQYQRDLGAFVDDTASETQRDRLRAHLTQCDRCRRAAKELRRTRELVAGLPTPRPSPRLTASLAAGLRAQRVGRAERLWWRVSSQAWFQPAAVMALLLCVVVTGGAIYHGQSVQDLWTHQAQVARVYGAPTVASVPPVGDGYLTACVADHETFDRDRAFGPPDDFQTVAYSTQ